MEGITNITADRHAHLLTVTFDTDMVSEDKMATQIKESLLPAGFFIDKSVTEKAAP